MPDEESYRFPEDFVWGAATAAYQVEGASREGGRGPSIWDEFSRSPGATHAGDTGDVACDQYHRYREDVELMRRLGLRAYRFSVSWPRVLPDGEGAANEEGLDYYDRLVDELLGAGVEPWVTLFHWDLPLAVHRKGGWRSRGTPELFGRYAEVVADRLGDRVRHWFTTNEMSVFTMLGHREGVHAPGLRLAGKVLAEIRHHALLAHGEGVRALRARASAEPSVGLAEDARMPVPVIETAENVEAARRAFRRLNAPYLTAVLEGGYMDEYLDELGDEGPTVGEGDFDLISQPLDFVGVNMYWPYHVRAADTAEGFERVEYPPGYPTLDVQWLKIGPEIAYWGPRLVSEIWDRGPVYISENGACCDDVVTERGEVLDTDRVAYLREHLRCAHRAVAEGYPLKGYFLWSLLDNFEWAEGYSKRFGIVRVDFDSLERTPKLSAEWYAEVIRSGRVV